MYAPAGPGSRHVTFQNLAEGVFAAIALDGGAAVANAGLIDLGGHVVVFDTCLTPQAAQDLRAFAQEALGQVPRTVINSHYHNDHIWGNQVLASEAHIASSRRTRELIKTEGQAEFRWYSANAVQQLQTYRSQYDAASDERQRKDLELWLGYYEGLVEALPHLSVCLPDITFGTTLELHGTRRTAELVTFEGAHTGSDTILVLPDDGVVFMSDILFVGFHPYLAEGDPQQQLAALRYATAGGATTFIPGHGPAGTVDNVRLMSGYIEHCVEVARQLIAEGADDARLAALTAPPQYAVWRVPQFYQANVSAFVKRLQATGNGGHAAADA